MIRLFLSSLCLLVVPGLATAGTWFDLGKAQSDTLRAEQDRTCHEVFPPHAFGVFPPGSWVWQEINVVSCGALRWQDQVCWNIPFIRGFRVEFNDGGCGCGGYVERPSTLQLTYDPAEVAARGLGEERLRMVFNDPLSRGWRLVDGALPDVDGNHFRFPWRGEILGIREYAIVSDAFTSLEPVTWSRIKTLYAD